MSVPYVTQLGIMSFLHNLESYDKACERNWSCRGRNILMQYDNTVVTGYVTLYYPRGVTSEIRSESMNMSSGKPSIKQRHLLPETTNSAKVMKDSTSTDVNHVQKCVCNPENFTTRQTNARAYIIEDSEENGDTANDRFPIHNNATINEGLVRQQVQEDNINFGVRRPEAFLWMQFSYLPKMYGCEWGKSYRPHARIMAVQIKKEGFDEIFRLYADERIHNRSIGDVAIEWAPDPSPMGKRLRRSFIRIGVRRDVLRLFEKYWLLNITDITSFVSRQGRCAQGGQLSCIWTPIVRVYIPVSSVVCRFLGVNNQEPAFDETKNPNTREGATETLNEGSSDVNTFGHNGEMILYLFGAFNPIHSGHIKALVACKRWLETTNTYYVCDTVIAVMSDTNLQSKLFNRPGELCIKFNHRINLCGIACSNHSWIQVCPFSPDKGQISFGEELRKRLNKPNATVGVVVGSDHVSHPPDSYRYLREQNMIMFCVGRKGMKGAEKEAFDKIMKNNLMQPHEVYVVPTILDDLSSTSIRQKLMQVNEFYNRGGDKQSNLLVIVQELIKLDWVTENQGRYICRYFDDLFLTEEEKILGSCREVQFWRQLFETNKK
ncbi:uncharacterized protein LOC123561709 [Mercenaria mercenaria]|uniref:uncharacterized protein LOC123561709 n=1 Tax=Mercenaria mercenaria TaxID=6596 RepID=UPI00234F823E|nr:uncharacterized protein LOC123561709 [Mercenaria mercenaria]